MPQGNGSAAIDVLGMGNAIVDVLARADDAFIAAHDLPKGGMTLIDDARADELYEAMGRGVEVSGGSCANTMAGAASFGSRAAYVGKVRDDQLGAIFAHDIRAAGVTFETPPAAAGAPTARCLILVTPDAQRTMCTYLGASVDLGPEDVDPGQVALGLGDLPRGLPLGQAAGQGRLPAGDGDRPPGGEDRVPDPVRLDVRGAPSRGVADAR